MAAVERNFKSPGYFPFPFPPYDIQEEFMKQLYEVLEEGAIGIFESPTGTVSETSQWTLRILPTSLMFTIL